MKVSMPLEMSEIITSHSSKLIYSCWFQSDMKRYCYSELPFDRAIMLLASGEGILNEGQALRYTLRFGTRLILKVNNIYL